MQIRSYAYSSPIDVSLGLYPGSLQGSEVVAADDGKSHLMTYVSHVSDDPTLRKLDAYFSGKVPEQGSNIVELIHKFVF